MLTRPAALGTFAPIALAPIDEGANGGGLALKPDAILTGADDDVSQAGTPAREFAKPGIGRSHPRVVRFSALAPTDDAFLALGMSLPAAPKGHMPELGHSGGGPLVLPTVSTELASGNFAAVKEMLGAIHVGSVTRYNGRDPAGVRTVFAHDKVQLFLDESGAVVGLKHQISDYAPSRGTFRGVGVGSNAHADVVFINRLIPVSLGTLHDLSPVQKAAVLTWFEQHKAARDAFMVDQPFFRNVFTDTHYVPAGFNALMSNWLAKNVTSDQCVHKAMGYFMNGGVAELQVPQSTVLYGDAMFSLTGLPTQNLERKYVKVPYYNVPVWVAGHLFVVTKGVGSEDSDRLIHISPDGEQEVVEIPERGGVEVGEKPFTLLFLRKDQYRQIGFMSRVDFAHAGMSVRDVFAGLVAVEYFASADGKE